MKELQLWIYTGTLVGQTRVILVADTTVGGAKGRLTGSYGCPGSKNGIPASAPGFPAWIKEPGIWLGIVPQKREVGFSRDIYAGLDRYSQDAQPHPPEVLPDAEDAFVYGKSLHEAQVALEEVVRRLLAEHYCTRLLKKR